MSSKEHMTTEDAWRAWKAACAVDLCDDKTALMLHRFGMFAFRSQLKKYASRVGHDSSPMLVTESKDAWHLLETHSQVGKNRAGKLYKDWLFQRAPRGAGWLNAVEAGAVLLMRDVVREHLRREYAPAFMTSMNRRVGDTGCTLQDLLPDELDIGSDIEKREWEELAKSHAEGFFPMLESRERIVLWARANGYGLYDERILKWTQSSKSVVYEVHKRAVERLCAMIKTAYPDEPASVLTTIAGLVLSELAKIISLKINQEKGAACFFKVI